MIKNSESKSHTVAIIAAIIATLVFLFLFLFLGISHRKGIYEDSKKMAKEISRQAAFETETYFNSALMVARSIESRALIVRKLGGTREQIKEILKRGLLSNPNFLSVWNLWEPNAFDGKDYLYKHDPLNNKDGLLGIGYFRYNDSVYTEIMTAADYLGPHYLAPKNSKNDVIVAPYKFVFSGYKQVFFGTTVSVPIIINNEFLGAIGVDIDLKNLQNNLNKVKLYKTGYLALIAHDGTIVSHFDTTIINKNIFELLSGEDTLSFNAIVKGFERTIETRSEFTGKKVFRFFYPINIGKGHNSWSIMVEIPINEATTRSKQLANIGVGVLIIGVSLLIYLIFNIIDRKRYEKEILLAKIKAEDSNRLKTAFLNNISHEIRTPLNGILGFTELLINSKSGDNQMKTYKDIIHSSSNQLLSVISSVIELSQIQSNQVEKILKEFDADNAINSVVNTFMPEIHEKGLKLIRKYPENVQDFSINSDEGKFKQIFTCLMSNAVKFTENGFIEVGFENQENEFLFYIKDTGVGIKPENSKDIFNYLNQRNSSYKRNYGGLGMGLSISKSYIDLLNGKIWFESTFGKGTTFYFTIPKILE